MAKSKNSLSKKSTSRYAKQKTVSPTVPAASTPAAAKELPVKKSPAAVTAAETSPEVIANAKPQLIAAKPLSSTKILSKKQLKKEKQRARDEARQREIELSKTNNAAVDTAAVAASTSDNDAKQPKEVPGSAPEAAVAASTKNEPVLRAADVPQTTHGSELASVSTREDHVADMVAAATSQKTKKRNVRPAKVLKYAAWLLIIFILPFAGFLVLRHQEQRSQTANQRLIDAVSTKAVLPVGETPAVSTVVDETKINQEFLRNTHKGDKVLLYFQAGQAVVYRPSTRQIVNMGPLQTPKPRVFVRSGAAKADVAGMTESINTSADFVFASSDVSPRQNYQKTIVVDVGGTRPDVAKRVAESLHATVAPMPDGESRPDADVLVIVGSDKPTR